MGLVMSISIRCFVPLILVLLSAGTSADTLTEWADKTTEIATDGPNTVRTLALAQNAVYEAVNAITSRYPRDRVALGPTQGASVAAALAPCTRHVPDRDRLPSGTGQTSGRRIAHARC